MESRVIQLLSYTAEERYLYFMETFPGIFAKLSQSMIASYLGITPESLSRIRKGINVKRPGKEEKNGSVVNYSF